jgi:hypothetical protein
VQIAGLIDGYLTTQLVYVAAKLGVAEVLAEGPRTGAEVAEAVGADVSALTRVLRGLAIEEVVEEGAGGRFALTSVGASVLDPGGPIVVRGELYYRAAAGLLDSVRDGGVAFESIYGEPFFVHLDRHPEHQSAFEASMAARAEREADDVVAAYDFTAFRKLVDVGGGRGVLLAAILRAAPALQAVLVERQAVLDVARRRLEADGVADRCEFVAADFFVAVPAVADGYLLSRVIHDWDDTDAVRILGTCRAAMPTDARLLLVEAVLPQRAVDQPAAIRMDLHMLVLFGARERTETEYRRLLSEAGLEFQRTVPTRSPAGLSVIEAAPA